jgi:hypothetical protein
MSQAGKIHALIQGIRDGYEEHWAERNAEQHLQKVERDKQCAEIQVKIEQTFPEDFPHLRKEP